jgi:acyl-CoA synthetase (NDP forming)
MPHPFDSFFAPKNIASIGASRGHETIPGRLLAMLRKNGYPGQLHLINPNYAEIDGLACYKTVAESGASVDLAIIVIPARAVLAALEQCAAVAVKNAVIISSGFAEEGGESAAMRDAIAVLAKATCMRICGPNAEGFFSQVQRVAATFSPAVDVKLGVTSLIASTTRIAIVAWRWSATYDAVYAKYGFIISNDLDEALTIKAALATNSLPKGDRVAVLTVSGGTGIWGADSVSAQGRQVSELSTPIQAKIMKLLPSYGTARHPIDVMPQGLNSGGVQRSIDLLAASDEVDAILVVLSLSSDVRMPFKEAEPKPVIAAQTKPIVFYSYTLPSDFARRTLAESHVVVLSGLTHVAVALRQLTRYARLKLAAPVDATLLPARDLFARLTAPALSEHDSKVLLREAGVAVPDQVAGDGEERARRGHRSHRPSARNQAPVA